MSYIGVEPTGGTFDKQVITGDGSNATFNLDFPVSQAAQLMVSLEGVLQEPNFAFNVSLDASQPKITFAATPANGDRIFIVYLGRTQLSVPPSGTSLSPKLQTFSGDGSTTAFTLSDTPSSAESSNFIVFVDNVYQRLGGGLAYTVSGSTITFTSAPPSGTNNIQVYQLSLATTLNTVEDGSISATKLSFDPADDATALAIALG